MVSQEQIEKAKILIVDDQHMNIHLLTGILNKAGYVNIISSDDSTRAVQLYKEIRPDLFVLDLNMPKVNGFQIMQELQESEKDDYLPILVLSNEENQEIRFKALESGAKDFLNKPYDRIEVVKRIHNLIEVRMLHQQTRNYNKVLADKVKERTQDLYDMQLDVIQRLARAIEYRDCETGLHIVRMSHYSACLASSCGMSMTDCDVVLTASPLHDIGKIGIPDSILRKPGKLTNEEWTIMKTHTIIGSELLSGSNSDFLDMARTIALTHHEKWDGTGYPNNLKGKEIPLVGRICGLCDVFDALSSRRPYKDAWSNEKALEIIKKDSGIHFDPDVVDAFIEILPQIEHIKAQYDDSTFLAA